MTTWPKHPDGRNKKVGEMTRDESRAVFQQAADRLKAEVESPAMQRHFERFLMDVSRAGQK